MEAIIEGPAGSFSSAKANVGKLLSRSREARSDLADYTAKATRAGVDEQTTLSDETFSEQEIAEELTRLH